MSKTRMNEWMYERTVLWFWEDNDFWWCENCQRYHFRNEICPPRKFVGKRIEQRENIYD